MHRNPIFSGENSPRGNAKDVTPCNKKGGTVPAFLTLVKIVD
jgi:hypothetical protein